VSSALYETDGLYLVEAVSLLLTIETETDHRLEMPYHDWETRTHSTTHAPKTPPPMYTYDETPTYAPMHYPKTPPRVAVVLPQDEQMELGRYRNPRGYSEWW